MADAEWKSDPTGRHELRYFDGQGWTDNVSDAGTTSLDPWSDSETGVLPPTDSPVGPEATTSVGTAERTRSRHWPWVAAIVAALLIGLGLGAVSQKGKVDDLNAQVSTLTHQRNAAVAQVHDREAQRRANLAKVAAHKAQEARAQKAAADKLAREQKAAADKAAAEQAKQQKAMADALAAAQAKAAAMSTIDSDGVYAIGIDKTLGRYHTDGAGECYYAVLNSPDTGDIATNNNVNGPTYVDLPAGKYFETARCGTWTKVG